MSPSPLRLPSSRFASLAVLLLNLTALGCGIAYLLFRPGVPGGNAGGVAFLLVLLVSGLLVLRMSGPGPARRRLPQVYSYVAPPTLLGIMAGNFLLSSRYVLVSPAVAGVSILVYGGFGALCVLGAWIAWSGLRTPPQQVPAQARPRSAGAVAGQVVGLVTSASFLAFALFLGGLLLIAGRVGHGFSWFAIFAAPFSLFWGSIGWLAAVSCGTAADRVKGRGRTLVRHLFVAFGALALVLHLLPVGAEALKFPQQREAFDALMAGTAPGLHGGRYDPLPNGFASRPFSMTGYFLGIPRARCAIHRNVPFFEGSAGDPLPDRRLRLFFDAFLPPESGGAAAAGRPVLIRIHGGGWRLGDKGVGNMMQVNRRFAAQGYAVFDLQYGLAGDPAHPPVITPRNVLGDFDLDDMMRHLGYFTRYLAGHAAEYGADLGRVFISGGSAGGQLTCALALALSGGDAPNLLGTGLRVRGFVPFYPANGVSPSWIAGQERWRNPESLVRADSPPCLIFQGSQDGMVNPATPRRLCTAYEAAGNPGCAVLLFPLAPHAADIYYSGFYSQVFLFFMDRFLYSLQ